MAFFYQWLEIGSGRQKIRQFISSDFPTVRKKSAELGKFVLHICSICSKSFVFLPVIPMPVPTTAFQFIELIRKSKLLADDLLTPAIAEVPETADPRIVARQLVEQGLLTKFQSEQLLRGKHRGYFLGKYKLLERIGMGGMGQVFLAQHTSMGRHAAIKVLPPELANNEYSRQRFLREARAAGQLDHPNLVRAYDVDSEGEVMFLVLEYIDGISLHDLVSKHGPLQSERAAYYLWQVANGLAYINSCGLVHRDIKPANLLVDRLGVVKILDLGLVRSQIEDDELTRGQGVKILGTADFLAPEQAIDCSSVDIRADLYSLGATGYFLLTGKTPYTTEKISQKLIAHQVQPIPSVREVRSDVPQVLADILIKLMAKKPEDRYATPEELMAALEPWAQLPPPPPSEQELPPAAIGVSAPSSGAIHLTPHPVRTDRGSGSSVSLHAIAACSGSSARLTTEPGSGLVAKVRSSGASSGRLPALPGTSPTNTPMPRAVIRADWQIEKSATPPGMPAPSVPPIPQPAGAAPASATPDLDLTPPTLPATQTHGIANIPLATEGLLNPFRQTKRAESGSESITIPAQQQRRRVVSLAIACAVILAIGIWDLILIRGGLPGLFSQERVATSETPASKP